MNEFLSFVGSIILVLFLIAWWRHDGLRIDINGQKYSINIGVHKDEP